MVVDKSLKSAKETMYESQIESIKSAASMWSTDNIELIPNNDYYVITLGKLEDDGYIKETIENPKTKEIFSRDTIIKINMKEIKIDDTLSLNDIMKDIAIKEIELLKTKAPILEDGVYYYDDKGNLERFNLITSIDEQRNYPLGNVLISNHQLINACLNYDKYNYEYYKNKLDTKQLPCSTIRGENLVINGDLSYKDNTNFSKFKYNSEGHVSITSSNELVLSFDDLIPIDTSKKYQIGVSSKINNLNTSSLAGFRTYDVDKNFISDIYVLYVKNTLTTLTHDLKPGDEYIYLENLTNWDKTTDKTYQMGFIFWNYTDSTGYMYPELTYSRNVFQKMYSYESNPFEIGVDIDGEIVNRIKLYKPWPKENGTIIAGTKLSQSNSGATFAYNLNLNYTNIDDFISSSNTIDGIKPNSASTFRFGSKYIKMYIISNRNQLPDVTYDFKDFYIKEITE